MQRLSTHLRGLLVALAALALTAGVAFAARPAGNTGLERATEASGKTVPTETTDEEPTVPEVDEDLDEDEPGTEDEEADEDADEDEDVDGEEAVDGERAENHGWYVSEAAKGETPEGYRNHGEYVSEIARGDDGKPGADEEPEDGDEAEAGEDDDGTAVATTAKGKDRADQAKARNTERKAGRGK
jgi:hypothetical protein